MGMAAVRSNILQAQARLYKGPLQASFVSGSTAVLRHICKLEQMLMVYGYLSIHAVASHHVHIS